MEAKNKRSIHMQTCKTCYFHKYIDDFIGCKLSNNELLPVHQDRFTTCDSWRFGGRQPLNSRLEQLEQKDKTPT